MFATDFRDSLNEEKQRQRGPPSDLGCGLVAVLDGGLQQTVQNVRQAGAHRNAVAELNLQPALQPRGVYLERGHS